MPLHSFDFGYFQASRVNRVLFSVEFRFYVNFKRIFTILLMVSNDRLPLLALIINNLWILDPCGNTCACCVRLSGDNPLILRGA